jgi:hypothetical protein
MKRATINFHAIFSQWCDDLGRTVPSVILGIDYQEGSHKGMIPMAAFNLAKQQLWSFDFVTRTDMVILRRCAEQIRDELSP